MTKPGTIRCCHCNVTPQALITGFIERYLVLQARNERIQLRKLCQLSIFRQYGIARLTQVSGSPFYLT